MAQTTYQNFLKAATRAKPKQGFSIQEIPEGGVKLSKDSQIRIFKPAQPDQTIISAAKVFGIKVPGQN